MATPTLDDSEVFDAERTYVESDDFVNASPRQSSVCSSHSTTPSESSCLARLAQKGGSFDKVFDTDKSSISRGNFAKAVYKPNGFACTIKAYANRTATCAHLQKELAITKSLRTVYVHRLFETCVEGKHVHLIGENCWGGSLADRLPRYNRNAPPLSEAAVARVVRQVLSAVEHMHANAVCHRDLRVENLMLATTAPVTNNVVKVSGFDFACNFTTFEPLTGEPGAPTYRAPEIFDGAYNHLVDLWSTGVLTYELICGELPFAGESAAEVKEQVQNGRLNFDSPEWESVSGRTQDFVSSLMATNPGSRPEAAQALQHMWMIEHRPFGATEEDDEHLVVLASARHYGARDEEDLIKEFLLGLALSHEGFEPPVRTSQCVTPEPFFADTDSELDDQFFDEDFAPAFEPPVRLVVPAPASYSRQGSKDGLDSDGLPLPPTRSSSKVTLLGAPDTSELVHL